MLTRRRFVASLPVVYLAISAFRPLAGLPVRRRAHPEPRKGIDASKVLTKQQLGHHPESIVEFDMVREMPQFVDGIRCSCGCAELPDHYSLLSCFEGDGMAMMCEVCKAHARLAHRLFGQKKTLDEIRAAIDERFG